MDSSESSDEKYEDDNRTGAEDNKYDGDRKVGGGRNTGTRGGSSEWLRLLRSSARTEALGAMAKAKASLSTASRKKPKLGKSKIKKAWKGKAA